MADSQWIRTDNSSANEPVGHEQRFPDCLVSVHPPHPERGAEIQINGRPVPIDEAVEVAEWILRAARPYSPRALAICGRISMGDAQQRYLQRLEACRVLK
jgi:hypothetical protein